MYEINESTDDFKGIVGIQDNFELVEVTYGPAGKDASSMVGLNFIFKRGENFTFKHTEFPINETNVANFSRKDAAGVELPKQEKIKNAYKEQASKIKHILTKFIPENEIILKGASFEEFSKSVIKLLGSRHVGKKVRLKLVYNKKNFLSFPKFSFIESMDVEKSKSQLRIDPKWDKLVKEEADKEEDEYAASSAPATTQSNAGGGDDF